MGLLPRCRQQWQGSRHSVDALGSDPSALAPSAEQAWMPGVITDTHRRFASPGSWRGKTRFALLPPCMPGARPHRKGID